MLALFLSFLFSLNTFSILNGDRDIELLKPFSLGLKIQTTSGEKYICSGIFIEKEYVLTAAHCLEGKIKRLDIVFGESLSDQNQTIARDILIHSSYRSNHEYDLALIKVDEPEFQGISPIQNFASDIVLPSKLELLIAGFGDTSLKSARMASDLNFTHRSGRLEVNQEKPRNACEGDSGGPVLYERDGSYWLVGVLRASNCHKKINSASFYTKITSAMIRSMIEQMRDREGISNPI